MNKLQAALLLSTLLIFASTGCSGEVSSPVEPAVGFASTAQSSACCGQTHLWGLYDVFVDVNSQTAAAVLNRQAMFTANVTGFLNTKPPKMTFKINDTPVGPGYIDVDIDVTLLHPFPGMNQYDGYDVRGVFMGNGSVHLAYNADLIYPVLGSDQFMLPDPDDGIGGPDGYTRWFNKTEFSTGGMPLFSYIQGNMATPGYSGTATLCPYRYFADGLDKDDDVAQWIASNPSTHGRFSAGAANTRNYYLRFPDSIGVRYSYAVIASWMGVEAQYHPANAPEAVACSVTVTPDIYYESPGNSGGSLIATFDLMGWGVQPSAIIVESTVLSSPHYLTAAEMTPVGGGETWSTWHVEIPADNVNSETGNEAWIIAEYSALNYKNDFGTTNLCGDDPLAACFRFDVPTTDKTLKLLTPNGGENWSAGSLKEITWTSTGIGSSTMKLEYSTDNFVSDINLISDSEPNDGSFMWAVACEKSSTVRVRITANACPTVKDVSDNDFSLSCSGWSDSFGDATTDYGYELDISNTGEIYFSGTITNSATGKMTGFVRKYDPGGSVIWSRQWPTATGYSEAFGVAVDGAGNVYVAGLFSGTVDFDPSSSVFTLAAKGARDCCLSKFTSDGTFVKAVGWGGTGDDASYDVGANNNNDVYVAGNFQGSVNFNPYGTDIHNSNGGYDAFVSRFNSDLFWQATQTWGGSGTDGCYDVDCDQASVFVSGFYSNAVDFDPGSGTYLKSSNGGWDAFFSRFGLTLDWIWTRTWGGPSMDYANGIGIDSAGNAYVGGPFQGNVDFDPGPGNYTVPGWGGNDSYFCKYDSSGNWLGVRAWGGSGYDHVNDVALTPSGEIYCSGEFSGTVDFDPGTSQYSVSAAGWQDSYLSKFDSNMNWQWTRAWGNTDFDACQGCASDLAGCAYVVGDYAGTENFAPTGPPCYEDPYYMTSSGGLDLYIVKYLPDGCW